MTLPYPVLLFTYSRLDLYLGWHDITLPRTVVFLYQAWPLSGRAWHYPTQNCCFLIPGLTFIWAGMTLPTQNCCFLIPGLSGGWGWAMVLGSFKCRGVLLLLHIVGQGPALLAAVAGRVGYIFYVFHLSTISNVLSFGRQLIMTEIL